ncbi:uncharacterized protein LOC144356671 [Saccoglossus kowalevskii]
MYSNDLIHQPCSESVALNAIGPFQGPEYSQFNGHSLELDWVFCTDLTPQKTTESKWHDASGLELDWVFCADVPQPDTTVTKCVPPTTKNKIGGKRPGSGRPRISDIFPGVVETAKTYVEENGFEAHKRRRETTGNCGVTRQQVKDAVFSNHPEVRERGLSISTISRWMVAPNKRFKASALYTADIDAKIPKTSTNNQRKLDENSHFYFTQVKYCMELASKYAESCVAISCDNMNKVKIGVPAVSRYHQQTRYFPRRDTPDFNDHDFPNPGYLITPAGYMLLKTEHSSPDDVLVKDDLGRDRFSFSRTGPMTVINRVDSYRPCNIIAHVTDLTDVMKNRDEPVLICVLDGGSDFNVNHSTNMMYYMRLWRDLNLDCLILTSYCPGYSAYNMIERGWSTLSKKLAGVVLPDKLPGDSTSPHQQRLPDSERKKKEVQVFNNAMECLQNYWSNVKHGSYPVTPQYESCDGVVNRVYNDYDRVHKLVQGGGAKKLREPQNAEILAEMKMMIAHVERRIGTLCFTKCQNQSCDHCSSNPVRAHDVMQFLRTYGLPSPVSSNEYEGHFQTFIEASSSRIPEIPNAHMPKYQKLNLGMCNHCRSYTFTSVADKTRHNRMFHPRR